MADDSNMETWPLYLPGMLESLCQRNSSTESRGFRAYYGEKLMDNDEPVVVEIDSCGACPHLDNRWTNPPWDCCEGGLEIYDTGKIHQDCPLDRRSDYAEGAFQLEAIDGKHD